MGMIYIYDQILAGRSTEGTSSMGKHAQARVENLPCLLRYDANNPSGCCCLNASGQTGSKSPGCKVLGKAADIVTLSGPV